MISVITICWNAEKVIGPTLKSILSQDNADFELIIVDGKSNDSTLSIANKVIIDSGFPQNRVKIISERDKGVFDAMNKGVRLAEGEYVIFMNCGDSFYANDVLTKLENNIVRQDNVGVYYGNTLMDFYEGIGIFHDNENTPRNKIMPFIHQSAITKRDVLTKHPFNLDYKICADFELYHWMRNNDYIFKHLDFVVSCYDAKDGLSENNPLRIRREKDRVMGIDRQRGYLYKKLFQRFTVGLIQPIKNFAPRWLLNIYFRKKKNYITWI